MGGLRHSSPAIDYRNEDFLVRVRELTGGKGVDVVLDSLGGPISLRSFPALRPGGRLVVFGRCSTLSHGHKNWGAVFKWYPSVAVVWVWGKLSPRRRVMKCQIQKFRDHAQRRDGAVGGEPRYPEWFQEDFRALIQLLREGKIHPVVAERLPLSVAVGKTIQIVTALMMVGAESPRTPELRASSQLDGGFGRHQ